MSHNHKLYPRLILIAVLLLAILPNACCPSSDGVGGDWNPDLLGGYRIAFLSTRDGSEMGDLYLMDLDGENVVKIASDQGYRYTARWSPDGTKIAFITEEMGVMGAEIEPTRTVHIVDKNGSSIASIDDLPDTLSNNFYWSPDSAKILFYYRNSDDETSDICMVDSDGNNLKLLVNIPGGPIRSLSWSRDSTKILFQSQWITDMPGNLYVINSDGSNLILLYDGIDRLGFVFSMWSPDSSKISYIMPNDETSDICVVNPDGTGLVNITNGKYGQAMYHYWSPDGQKIIFTSTFTDELSSAAAYSVNVNGTDFTEITVNGQSVLWEIPSPDSSKIFQIIMPEEEIEESIYDLYITDANRQNPIRILDNFELRASPKWAPDSSMLAYPVFRPDEDDPDDFDLWAYDIYVMNADGTGTVELASVSLDPRSFPPVPGAFYWSPNSRHIVFPNAIDENEEIFKINTDGTELVNLTNDPGRDWYPILSQ